MTLNQVVNRIRTIALGHRQIRTFRKELLGDLFADKTAKYPAACLQDFGGNISLSGHSATLNYKLFLLDLVHVSDGTKDNEQDVESDMVSIAMDILAQLNNPNYSDWIISTSNNIDLVVEHENDMIAGCIIDFSVRIQYAQNICQIPTDINEYIPNDTDMKNLYDVAYIATGSEGTTLSIPEIVGKKILLVTRDSSIIYKTSSAPGSSEYTWNDIVIELGAVTSGGNRFLILYRNY